ncbi:antitoxin Xre/MbcA/ParS toxin-binding domain-containing protein [Pseudomonas lactis]|uniref:antitoxin Xre/MbcA/ParS toxin-binding domain-containing protein n=1 Tax=Pseudomonas lactis TaxID=1615674 RepID=UPI00190E1B15|nr:DUF2384 domain-containing protein [Pseudomonas lactis]
MDFLQVWRWGSLASATGSIQAQRKHFKDAGKAKHWLSTPKARFSGSSPYAMLSTTQGTYRVEEMLIQAAKGMSF